MPTWAEVIIESKTKGENALYNWIYKCRGFREVADRVKNSSFIRREQARYFSRHKDICLISAGPRTWKINDLCVAFHSASSGFWNMQHVEFGSAGFSSQISGYYHLRCVCPASSQVWCEPVMVDDSIAPQDPSLRTRLTGSAYGTWHGRSRIRLHIKVASVTHLIHASDTKLQPHSPF
jgi:hypothetical protein